MSLQSVTRIGLRIPSTSYRHVRISRRTLTTSQQSSLQSLLPPAGSWQLSSSGTALERTFTFRTFKAAWSFMSQVATHASKQRHHPEWSNIYNRVFVRWTTHTPPGLSVKDVEGAQACDEYVVKMAEDSKSTVEGAGGGVAGDGGDVRGLVEDAKGRPEGGMGKAWEESEKLKEKREIEQIESEEGKEGSLAGIGGQPT